MQTLIIISIWICGFILSYVMQRTEIASEKEIYTTGDRVLNLILSLLSFGWVLVILIMAWVKQIDKTGYWNNPVKKDKDIIVTERPYDKKVSRAYANSTDN